MSMRKPRRPVTFLLILSACLIFLSLMGWMGGVMMIQDPSGSLLGMQLSWLETTPFQNYLLPGVWLLVVYGLGSILILYGLWVRPDWGWLNALTGWTHEHWAWDFSLLLGLVLMIWVAVQIILIPMTNPIQVVTFAVGLVLTGLPLLPEMRRYYAQ